MHYKTLSILCTLLAVIILGACSEQSDSLKEQTELEESFSTVLIIVTYGFD